MQSLCTLASLLASAHSKLINGVKAGSHVYNIHQFFIPKVEGTNTRTVLTPFQKIFPCENGHINYQPKEARTLREALILHMVFT